MRLLDRLFPPPAIRIGALDTQAASRLAALHLTAFARPWSTLEFERLLAERNVRADGLFFGNGPHPVGFVMSRIVIDEAEILTVALGTEVRGRGHSRTLLASHLDGMRLAGIAHVHLEVEEGNVPALALYRRHGFEEIGRRDGYYRLADDSRAAALTMRLDL